MPLRRRPKRWRDSERRLAAVSCCVPRHDQSSPGARVVAGVGGSRRDAVDLPGGEFRMGDDGPLSYPEDGEAPVRPATVAPFALDRCAVTVAEFAAFATATGYRTDAERLGRSFVFAGLLPDDFPPTRGVAAAPWWREVAGASWHRPEGPGSSADDRTDHPVVHVSWNDAHAFAGWCGGRLPSEAEWEYAARAGAATTFPWGEQLAPDGAHLANVWQGRFPDANTCEDGYYATCPVSAFPPNRFGLHNMIGNVWEWTSSPFLPGAPAEGFELALKGGSYLCHESYCHRYRPAARSGAAPDSSAGNVGFRCAY
jgi:formylglycine-generating enzyme required for sulfatase activity